MEIPSFDKNTVEHQFDTLVKKVLAGEAKNQKAEIAKRAAHEANFSELSNYEIADELNLVRSRRLRPKPESEWVKIPDHALNRRGNTIYFCEYGKIAVKKCSSLIIQNYDLKKVVFDTIRAQALYTWLS